MMNTENRRDPTEPPPSRKRGDAPGQSTTPKRPMGASVESISQHYDLSDEFFKLRRDPEMIYSCALFDGTSDLAAAQLRKLDYHIEAAAATGAARRRSRTFVTIRASRPRHSGTA